MIKELEAHAIVAKAEKKEECAAIGRLVESLGPLYKEAIKLRARLNATSFQIGKLILEACRAPEIEAQLTIVNCKDRKLTGGTATRAHSWIAEKLAEQTGYNAEYLKQCARQYLAAVQSHCDQTKQERPEYTKAGTLKCALKQLPAIEDIKPPIEHPKHPRMDEIFASSEAHQTEKSSVELARELAAKVTRSFGEADRTAWKEFFKALQPIAEATGFDILPKSSKGGNFK